MADTIKDGKGRGYLAQVDSENRLHVESTSMDEAAHYSQHDGDLYSWTVNDNTSGAEYVLAIRNNSSTKHLCIETIRGASDVASIWTTSFGTWSTVGGGELIEGENAKASVSSVADATAYITATNIVAKGRPILNTYAPAGSEKTYRPEGKIVLGQNDVIYLHNSAASTAHLTAVIWGYFKEIE